MSQTAPILLLRADGGPGIGAGHVMRGLALAQAWRDAGGRAACLSHRIPPWLRDRLLEERVDVHDLADQPAGDADARATGALAGRLGADWLAVDGYRFDARYLAALARGAQRTLAIDDMAALDDYPVDALLNPNLHAEGQRYASIEGRAVVMLGTRYALLRREFWSRAGAEREVAEQARRLLVSFGGIDSHELVLRLLPALERLAASGLEVVLLAGALDARRDRLEERVRAMPGVALMTDVRDVPGLMAGVDLACAAAGGTCWELAAMRVPALVFALAENQRPLAQSLARAGAAVDLGWHERLTAGDVAQACLRLAGDADRRRALAATAGRLVDGEGGRRVVMRLRGDRLRLRPARREDCRMLWEWVNEPSARASAFASEPIPWETHRRWFASRDAAGSVIFIAVDADDRPVGQVRFDPAGDGEAEIDISVAPERRGQGEGSRLIALGTDRLFRETPVTTVHAFVKPDNAPSLRAFARAGFERLGPSRTPGREAIHCRIERAS